MRKWIYILYFLIILFGCQQSHNDNGLKNITNNNPIDTFIQVETQSNRNDTVFYNKSGIELFIDSMKTEGYLLDTNRLREVYSWNDIAKYPKGIINKNVYIKYPFPIKRYRNNIGDLTNVVFSNPRTYFFAKWNSKDSTFKNGNDYILMSWSVNDEGVKQEKIIFQSLIHYRDNFPIFCFRSGTEIFTLMNRKSVTYKRTKKVAEKLRDYINKESIIYDYRNIKDLQ